MIQTTSSAEQEQSGWEDSGLGSGGAGQSGHQVELMEWPWSGCRSGWVDGKLRAGYGQLVLHLTRSLKGMKSVPVQIACGLTRLLGEAMHPKELGQGLGLLGSAWPHSAPGRPCWAQSLSWLPSFLQLLGCLQESFSSTCNVSDGGSQAV